MSSQLNRTVGRLAVGMGALLAVAGHAFGAGGVIEFNQARALAGGVTPGDTPGFPVTISQSGSYRLSGNLTVPDANTTAISITADNVTIDLNGFSIIGPTVCSVGSYPIQYVTSCTPTGTGKGIDSNTAWKEGTTVVNGTVQGMGSVGVNLGPRARVEKVRAVSNGYFGIQTSEGLVATGNIAARNGQSGIAAFGAATAAQNVAENNAGDGIDCSDCVVTGNVLEYNGGCGVQCGGASTVIGNTTAFNWCGINFAGGAGGYANNTISASAGYTVFQGTDMGHNVCNGTTTCP